MAMEGSKLRTQLSTSEFEGETQQLDYEAKARLFRLVDTARVVLTAVGLAAALAALGLSADTLLVYNNTHVPAEFLLPLWPDQFDLRPTHALIAASTIVIVVNSGSILASRIASLRQYPIINKTANLGAPAVSFIVALVAMALFYGADTSDKTHTIQSWTCRWRDVAMLTQPYFGTLCQQSKAGLALAVLLVPLEAVVLGVAVFQLFVQKTLDEMVFEKQERKQSSPALS
jgi:hypothetical protein